MSEEAWRDYSSISGHRRFSPANSGSIGCNFDKLILLTSQSLTAHFPLKLAQSSGLSLLLSSWQDWSAVMTLDGPIKLNANIMQQILEFSLYQPRILCTNPVLYIGFNMTRSFGLKHLKLVLEIKDTSASEMWKTRWEFWTTIYI